MAFAGFEGSLTPVGDYSTPKGTTLAQKYGSNLARVLEEITRVYKPEILRPLNTQESTVGAAGFWKNPAKFGTDNRYMGVLFIATKPTYIFGDDRNGHVASVLDKYGKSILESLTKELEAANDPNLDGVAICIIWGDSVNGNPSKTGQEGMALFLAKSDVLLYKQFKLTIQNLVNRNDLFLFNGPKELENLIQFILEA
jgi:hypothetical protein